MNTHTTPYNWNILTYGMMLAGKSYIGKKLAEKLWINFEDLDDYLVKYLWVADIWEYISDRARKHGWDSIHAWKDFWDVENKCLQILFERDDNKLIAAWWKTVMYEPNRKLIRSTQGLVRYYLEVDYDEQVRRAKEQTPKQLVNRPALQHLSGQEIENFFSWMQLERSEIYRGFSDENVFNTWGSFDDIVDAIIEDIHKKQSI